jgi:enamine deaminase RidA (YjgF/YER057c/UK114 family)
MKKDVYRTMKENGISLTSMKPPDGVKLRLAKSFSDGKLVYVSGCGSEYAGEKHVGAVGKDLSVEQGAAAARTAAMGLLAALEGEIGDLNRVKSIVKTLVFVASAPNFYNQPLVANGASQCLTDVFGEDIGLSARSAVGMVSLPNRYAVEIEALVEIE